MTNVTRIAGMLQEEGLDWAVLSGADAVCFATGHVVGIEIGQTPFHGGPTLAFVSRDGAAAIVAPNVEGTPIEGVHYESYAGFANEVVPQAANFRASVAAAQTALGIVGRIGSEAQTHPAAIADLLPSSVDLKTPIDRLRAIKTNVEIEAMRLCGRVAAAGQETARAASIAGKTELTVWNEARSVMENMAGGRCAMAGEYIVSKERTAMLGLPISDTVIRNGDPVVCDLAPRVNGYWGDSCSAFIVGVAPSDTYLEMWHAARGALDHAMDELRPGLSIGAFDSTVRELMAEKGYSYPHHTGHGVGTSVHEWPRLVPDEGALIEENMVLMVEPGSYVPGLGGLRTEFMLRVTATGCENLTEFRLDPSR